MGEWMEFAANAELRFSSTPLQGSCTNTIIAKFIEIWRL